MVHSAFQNAGRKGGLQIWRIQNFEPVPVPQSDYGKFFSGDSYIVLNTKQNRSGDLSWDIHFWLGETTTQDESGSAAILSVELDDGLGGGPVQHREVQGYESQLFVSYFKSGVRYVPGGAASGFHHAEVNAPGEKRLYQVKGKKNIRVRMVELSAKSMNRGDCFILDTGSEIYVYVGAEAKGTEKFKAISAATTIRDQDHAGRGHITVIDSCSSAGDVEDFFRALGSGSAADIKEASAGGDDAQFEAAIQNEVKLYRVSDAGGSLKSELVAEKPLRQRHLDTSDCYILDAGKSGIYVWVGKGSTSQEKISALKMGQDFIKNNNYPAWTKLKRIVEGAEPPAFKDYFIDWKDEVFQGSGRFQPDLPTKDGMRHHINTVRHNGNLCGHSRIYMRKSGTAAEFMPDDGSGKVEVFRIEDFKLEPVPAQMHGFFFAGDSYIVKYTYRSSTGQQKYILYFWLGEKSTNDEKGSAALHTVRLDDELAGKALQIRVEQDHEPAHFIKIFKGRMVILMGGKASGFRNVKEHDTFHSSATRLFQIAGSSGENVRARQVAAVGSSLNTNDVFILETPDSCYVWLGKGSNAAERSTGKGLVDRLCVRGQKPVHVEEGEEDDGFWAPLGGQTTDYCRQIIPDQEETITDQRRDLSMLYHCHMAPGKPHTFSIEHVPNFSQHDLYPDDVMLLDSGDEIYVWIGQDSEPEEKELTMKHVQKYLEKRHSSKSRVVLAIKQNEEPECFKKLFDDWNDSHWKRMQGYDDLKNKIMGR